jgi:hypothetical protein
MRACIDSPSGSHHACMPVRYSARMEEDRRHGWRQSAALQFVALLLLLVSPVGAPMVGYFVARACGLAWEGETQCAVPGPLIDYFVGFPIVAAIHLGLFLSILWLFLSFAVLLCCLWCGVKAVWQAMMERP